MGHSFGCLIVRGYGLRWPDRVAGLVLVDSSVRDLQFMSDEPSTADGDRSDATGLNCAAGALELRPLSLRVPSVVLSKAAGAWGDWQVSDEYDAEWQRTQRELADEIGAVQIIAHQAGHRLHEETPALVALAVDAVTRAAAADQPVSLDAAHVDAAGGRIARQV